MDKDIEQPIKALVKSHRLFIEHFERNHMALADELDDTELTSALTQLFEEASREYAVKQLENLLPVGTWTEKDIQATISSIKREINHEAIAGIFEQKLVEARIDELRETYQAIWGHLPDGDFKNSSLTGQIILDRINQLRSK